MPVGAELFNEWKSRWMKHDLEGIAQMYHDGIERLSLGQALQRRAQVEQADHASIASGVEESFDHCGASDDVVLFKATARTHQCVTKRDEAWLLRDGKIYRQLVISLPQAAMGQWLTAGVSDRTDRTIESSATGRFFREHLDHAMKGDWEFLQANHYHDDIEMVSFGGTRRGKAAIGEYNRRGPEVAGRVKALSVDHFAASPDMFFFKHTLSTEKIGVVKEDEAVFLKNGKVFRYVSLNIAPEALRAWVNAV